MSQLTKQFEAETGNVAMYKKNGADWHTLKYVNWLEAKVENLQQTHNRPKAPCPNLWHDGLHDGCGICPDCGEVF